jgi:vancomycin resistance protein YoaR
MLYLEKIIFIIFLPFFLIMITGHTALYSAEELVTVSSYTTSVEDKDFNIKTNISIAAGKLNGTAVTPGEIFSFNKIVGDGSAANGFLTGRVLYQDKTVYEPGGGICQVSSTLFNALLLAGCTITERHRHSQPVIYVPLGLDATIKYGKKDLRMKNISNQVFYIFTVMNDKSFTVMIKAGKSIQNSFEVYTEEEEVSLPFRNNENQSIRPGISIYVYRKKLLEGKVLENSLLYKDFYPPVSVDK